MSLTNAIERLGYRSTLSSDPSDLLSADLVILPGVGAFEAAMKALRNSGLDTVLKKRFKLGRPILGICLGLQLFYETSTESDQREAVEGLGFLKGSVNRLPEKPSHRIPHMGWNELENFSQVPSFFGLNDIGISSQDSSGLPYVYFTHSYYVCPEDPTSVKAYAQHGVDIPAIVYDGSVLLGFQFHPEKSGPYGLALLRKSIEYLLSTRRETTNGTDTRLRFL